MRDRVDCGTLSYMSPEEETLPEQEPALGPDDQELQRLIEAGSPGSYIQDVVDLYEATERNYRAAVMAGAVVNGFSDSTNF